MGTLELLLYGSIIVTAMMAGLSLVERWKNDASIVDVGWSLGLAVLVLLYAFAGTAIIEKRMFFLFVAGLWSFRLATFLFINRVYGKEEDGRYQRLRAHWGDKAHRYFFYFFLVQASWAVMFSLPFLLVVNHPAEQLTLFDLIGLLIGVGAIAGETTADFQLARFRENSQNKGKTCRRGLWRYSRHPNYFFEWLHWFAYIFFAVGTSFWWLSFWGPALMLLFLFKITGIPHTEKQAIASRGDDYRRYQKETSMFIPWFPKS